MKSHLKTDRQWGFHKGIDRRGFKAHLIVFICGGEILKQVDLCPGKSTEEAVRKDASQPGRHDHSANSWAFWREYVAKLPALWPTPKHNLSVAQLTPGNPCSSNHPHCGRHPERLLKAGCTESPGRDFMKSLTKMDWVSLTKCSVTRGMPNPVEMKGVQKGIL